MQMLLIQVSIQSIFAIIIYYGIVQRRRTPAAYLLGWGCIIPVIFLLPYQLIRYFDIHSTVIKMSMGTPVYIIVFRTIEAMYETSPAVVETSVGTYIVYYSTVLHFEWYLKTGKRRKVTATELLQNVGYVLLFANLASLLLSIEFHYNFNPFYSVVVLPDYHFSVDIFTIRHLANMYLLGLLVYSTLRFGFAFLALGEQAKGYYTKPIFYNPLFTSRSPSEFWGRKWNLMIHRVMKHGCYLPAVQYMPKVWAIFVTFVVSGLMHDYIWSIMFDTTLSEHEAILLRVTAFFAYNGVIMLLERPVGLYLSPVTRHLPTAVVSTMVVCLGLPVVHWYAGDWVAGGYFEHLSIGLWQIRKLI
jgi:hypothetical protein